MRWRVRRCMRRRVWYALHKGACTHRFTLYGMGKLAILGRTGGRQRSVIEDTHATRIVGIDAARNVAVVVVPTRICALTDKHVARFDARGIGAGGCHADIMHLHLRAARSTNGHREGATRVDCAHLLLSTAAGNKAVAVEVSRTDSAARAAGAKRDSQVEAQILTGQNGSGACIVGQVKVVANGKQRGRCTGWQHIDCR